MKQMEFVQTITRVVEANLGLIIEYRMRPVLMVPVLGPVCQYAAATAMIGSQFGSSVWIFWAISSCYQAPLDRASKDRTAISFDQLHPDPGSWEETLKLYDTEKGMVFFWRDVHVAPG